MRSILKVRRQKFDLNFLLGKKGESADIIWPEVMFIILLLAFSAVFFIFARDTLNGSLIQEEIFAKKIALFLDSAQPGTYFMLDLTDLNNLAIKSGEKRNYYTDLVSIENNTVKVSLRLGNSGYRQTYFSDYNVTVRATEAGGKIIYALGVKENE